MSAHTPGPWVAQADGSVTTADGAEIAHVFEFKNMQVIAAAPNLLSALQNMVADWQGYCDETESSMVAARAAIARATGAA